MSKKFTVYEVMDNLKKALHQAIAKADPDLKAILTDLQDKDAIAEVPEDMKEPQRASPALYKADKKIHEKDPILGSKPEEKAFSEEKRKVQAAKLKQFIEKQKLKKSENLENAEDKPIDEFKHHRLMAGYHEQRFKHHSKIANDFNSSSDPEVRAQSKVHSEKANNHSKHSEEHLAEAHAHHEPAKHGPWNKTAPTEKESLEYGKKN
jgi:hypothetical protein